MQPVRGGRLRPLRGSGREERGHFSQHGASLSPMRSLWPPPMPTPATSFLSLCSQAHESPTGARAHEPPKLYQQKKRDVATQAMVRFSFHHFLHRPTSSPPALSSLPFVSPLGIRFVLLAIVACYHISFWNTRDHEEWRIGRRVSESPKDVE